MRLKKLRLPFLVLPAAVLLWAGICPPAHAYVDPGSGVLLWQGLLAAMFGSLFYARRLTDWVKSRFQDSTSPKE